MFSVSKGNVREMEGEDGDMQQTACSSQMAILRILQQAKDLTLCIQNLALLHR